MSGTSYYWRVGMANAQSTVWSNASMFTTLFNLVVYPNPGSLAKNSHVVIAGDTILEVWIYDVNAQLIAHAIRNKVLSPGSLPQTVTGFSWLMTNSSGRQVAPGLYYCDIGYKDKVTKGVNKKRKKIIVIP